MICCWAFYSFVTLDPDEPCIVRAISETEAWELCFVLLFSE